MLTHFHQALVGLPQVTVPPYLKGAMAVLLQGTGALPRCRCVVTFVILKVPWKS